MRRRLAWRGLPSRPVVSDDIHSLCFRLYQLPMDQLRSLEDVNVIPGLRLRDAQDREEVCDKVRAALESCESHHERLHQLASAYCWLFPRYQRLKWALFELDRSMPPVDDFTLQMLIATALSLPGADLAYVPVSNGKERYACAITAERQSDLEGEHIVVGMCAWEDLPYLAICLPGNKNVTRVEPHLERILKCKSDDILVGCYAGIDETLAEANIHHIEVGNASDIGSMDIYIDSESED
ncbi:hypothetical protein MTO96_034210 [Rhipicephalus appendiculatus]